MSQKLDFPIWTHSSQNGPLHHHITIQPKSAIPGSNWMVKAKIEAPPGWSLKQWKLVDKPSPSGLAKDGIAPSPPGSPWTIEVEYSGDLPPFGPGPQLETIWETPDGPVSLLIDSGLTLSTTDNHGALIGNPTTFPWAPALVLAIILLAGIILIWIRQRPKIRIRRWGRKLGTNQPDPESPWPVWEAWLNRAARSARSGLPQVPEARALITLLDEARFGLPFNPSWLKCRRIIFGDKTLDNLPK